jgi:periplasmic protein TonB
MRDDSLDIPLICSLVIHGLVMLLGSVNIHNTSQRREDFLPIRLVDLPTLENPPQYKKTDAQTEIKKPLPSPKLEKPQETPPVAKTTVVKPELPAPPPTPAKEEPATTESTPSFASDARRGGGGSEPGAASLLGNGDVGIVPGSGTSGEGGTAASESGRNSGAPGPPTLSVLRTNREAKPIQTVRAAYPAMALRAGLQSDVTLRIEVDPGGNVTKAEIIRSGGGGFDEEALKAVMQSRFEPAQKDGQNVPAEFTYIYRFRLQR